MVNKLKKLKGFSLILGTIFTTIIFLNKSVIQAQSHKEELSISLDSPTGEELLFNSKARHDYIPLSLEFVTQDNLAYCGVATLVMILNALKVEAPKVPNYTIPGIVSYRFFTQENVFDNDLTRQVIAPELVAKQGMTLKELEGLFASYQLETQTFHGDEVTLQQFRELAVKNLQESENFIAINYLRPSVGQEGGGHISPIAAYNKETDQFLILDVARYRYSPVWVDAKVLWEAMKTVDSTSGKTRGFILISKPN